MMGQTMDQSEFRSQAELCDAELADKVCFAFLQYYLKSFKNFIFCAYRSATFNNRC